MDEKRYGEWFPKGIDGQSFQDLADWLDHWDDFDKHPEASNDNKFTEYGRGYEQAISDVFSRLDLNWKMYDNRTKDGFKKQSGQG